MIILNNLTPTANAATTAALGPSAWSYSNGTNNDGVGATLTSILRYAHG
jgi:hypothetical protein